MSTSPPNNPIEDSDDELVYDIEACVEAAMQRGALIANGIMLMKKREKREMEMEALEIERLLKQREEKERLAKEEKLERERLEEERLLTQRQEMESLVAERLANWSPIVSMTGGARQTRLAEEEAIVEED
ncbi:hypothetical protein EV426DRAFT_579009 [Tirmania nivea]|nr:hypothetical protein EV426DRAFT_579009 [Tirmania nivea]